MNSDIYFAVVAFLQLAQAQNIPVPGGRHYNLPSQNITHQIPPDAISPPGLTSYTWVAISGADDFGDGKTTIKDIFDIIVETTREVTATCESPVIIPCLFDLPTRPRTKLERSGLSGTCRTKYF